VAFEKSLGDFDGEIGGERAAMAKAGTGSGRAAEGRESGDSSAVKSAGRGIGVDGSGSGADRSSAQGGSAASGGVDGAGIEGGVPTGTEAGSQAGAGKNQSAGSGAESPSAEAGKVAKIPDDIPTDLSAEDQVARQIREAAEAETDPKIREALWNEYRKQMGLKTK
jgi:hypothetical protein